VSAPLFAFEAVTVDAPDGARILGPLDGEIPAGGITVVRGPSGAGKTTLLRLANRLALPTSGTVRFRGEDVAGLDPLALRRRVGMVFQAPVMLEATVAADLRLADPGLDDRGVASLLNRVGLDPEFAGRETEGLSGGEAQRACIARALATGPEVLLADEPTSALDPERSATIEALVRRLAGEGLDVVWVTHLEEQARRLADRVLTLGGGRLAAEAPSAA
jgi:putative ABC transport system ATP-binding protein